MTNLTTLALLGLAGYRGTQLAVHDTILDPVRDRITAWHERRLDSKPRTAVVALISCVYCMGWWVSGALLARAGRGRVAFTSGSKPTATTVAQRYAGSAVRIKGTDELVHHTETYEVAKDGGKGAVVFAHSLKAEAVTHAKTLDGAVVRERETGTVVHPAPAADITKAEQTAEAPA
ncbi:DUF1360 domain-containing protein [Streptomyces sp. NPDC054834]